MEKIIGALVGDRQDARLLARYVAAATRQQGQIGIGALFGNDGARLATKLDQLLGRVPCLAVDIRQHANVLEELAAVLEADPLHRILAQRVTDRLLAAHLTGEGVRNRRHAVGPLHRGHRPLAPEAGGALCGRLIVADADPIARRGAADEAEPRHRLSAETFVAYVFEQIVLEAGERALDLERELGDIVAV